MKALNLVAGLALALTSASALSFTADELHSEIWSDVEAVSKSCIRTDQLIINDELRVSVQMHSLQNFAADQQVSAKDTNIETTESLQASR